LISGGDPGVDDILSNGDVFSILDGTLSPDAIQFPSPLAGHNIVRLDDNSFFIVNTRDYDEAFSPAPAYFMIRVAPGSPYNVTPITPPTKGRRNSATAGKVRKSDGTELLLVAGGLTDAAFNEDSYSTEIYDIGRVRKGRKGQKKVFSCVFFRL